MQPPILTTVLSRASAATGDRIVWDDLPPILRRSLELMLERAGDDFGTADLADALGISQRALQYGFREYLGATPGTVHRWVRLELVHNELAAREEFVSGAVAEVAAKYGFFHPGRFAAQYAEVYGRRPSETLNS